MPLKALSTYFAGIPPMFIDGLLYVMVALFTSLSSSFGGDEAAKYVSAQVLFYIKTFCTACAAIFLAAKMFRSTAYSDHQAAKQAETGRSVVNIPVEVETPSTSTDTKK